MAEPGGVDFLADQQRGADPARHMVEQVEPLGELLLRWTAEDWSDESLANLGADYDG